MKTGLLICVCTLTVVTFAAAKTYACNLDPVASLSAYPNPVCVGQSVTLDGSASSDPDGGNGGLLNGIKKFEWDWTNDGEYDYEETPGDGIATHIYTIAGTYTAKLRVTDNDAAEGGPPDKTDTATRTVYVVKVNSVTANKTIVCVCETVTFTANPYPSGKPLSCIEWQKRYRENSEADWGDWVAADGGDNTAELDTCTAGLYQYRARNGSGDTWKESLEVKVLLYKLVVEAPEDVTSGEAFSVTVKAVECLNPDEIYTDYRGTITFSTDDPAPNITLPGNYTFTEADNGSDTFNNVVLRTVSGTGHTRWIKAEDTSDAVVPGKDTVNMWFSVGATIEFYRNCPWPGGELSYGAQTACDPGGLPADSIFVALPATTVPCGTQVIVKYGASTETAPLRDRGPMTTSDPYWNEDGLPEHPARAIDLSDGLASELGIDYGCANSTPYGAADVEWRFE